MGGRPEKTFFQGGHADGQQAHEKTRNIANHQENASENHNQTSTPTCQSGHHQKEHK